MLVDLQYRILMRFFSRSPQRWTESIYQGKSKLGLVFEDKFLGGVAGKTVIDFGCGEGLEVIDLSKRGARRVIGLDSREDILQTARGSAAAAGVGDSCWFATSTQEVADLVICIDAFEHFDRPREVLDIMNHLLRPGGEVLISFGWPWYHPLGGHLFSVFPWAHLVFSEQALIRWRSTFKTDGAKRFSEVEGGLNQMSIRRFERLVAESPLSLAALDLVPIRKLAPLHNRLTREFTTAVVRCRLRKPDR